MEEGNEEWASHKSPCLDFILETVGALNGVTHSYLHFRKSASTWIKEVIFKRIRLETEALSRRLFQ